MGAALGTSYFRTRYVRIPAAVPTSDSSLLRLPAPSSPLPAPRSSLPALQFGGLLPPGPGRKKSAAAHRMIDNRGRNRLHFPHILGRIHAPSWVGDPWNWQRGRQEW